MPETMVGDVEHGYVLSNDANTVLLSEREAEATLTRWRRIAEQEGLNACASGLRMTNRE